MKPTHKLILLISIAAVAMVALVTINQQNVREPVPGTVTSMSAKSVQPGQVLS